MDWRPYGPCCQRYAPDVDAAFCPECRHPLLRCMAFAECRSLVSATGPCPVCVAPALSIDAGAVVQSKAGERLSVPLILKNASPAPRPIWIKQIARLDGHREDLVALTWEQIEPGAERRFSIDTPPLDDGGTHSLRLLVVVATRHRGLEEAYAFSAGTTVAVSSKGPQTINQTINVDGVQAEAGGVGTGGAVNAPLNIHLGPEGGVAGLRDRMPLPLDRAERYELEHGLRGYRGDGVRVPRHVPFAFSGFRAADRPDDGTTIVVKGRLACGRNSRRARPEEESLPNDLCLRAYDPRTGEVDEPATMAISRHHFDLVVVNDRLSVHARTTRGMQINGRDMVSGEVVPIVPGDHVIPIAGRPDKLSLGFAFTGSMGVVDRVTISRVPATP